jgi:hypothetical protein
MFELIGINFNQPSLSVFSSHSISACCKLGVNDRNDYIIIKDNIESLPLTALPLDLVRFKR